MSLPGTLKGLQELCKQKNLKYKGKSKSQPKEILEDKSDETENEV
jgi:hypothetical protein